MPKADDRFSLFSDTSRINLLMFSAILIVVSIAGSVGEAAFQLRQALETRKHG
jgi:hypothetical protein